MVFFMYATAAFTWPFVVVVVTMIPFPFVTHLWSAYYVVVLLGDVVHAIRFFDKNGSDKN